jgi:hypothetical protein
MEPELTTPASVRAVATVACSGPSLARIARQEAPKAACDRATDWYERARLLFDADVFWATEAIGMEEIDSWLSVYHLSRNIVQRGIVEVIFDD